MNWEILERSFRANSNKLYVLALSITGEPSLAEDAVHDALVALVKSKSQPANPDAYIYATVRNTATKMMGKQVRSTEYSKLEFLAADNDNAEDRVFLDQVNLSLALLPSDKRETIILHIYGGFTFREISELKNKPLNTITSWYRRGISVLRKKCDKDNEF